MKEPRTPAEWQNAVDAAEAAMALNDARLYGLVTGGPSVNVDRCDDILRQGAQRGFHPGKDAIERYIAELLEANAERLAALRKM